jgi:hypothetical protein
MLSKEPYNARVEVAVKGHPVEACRIGANTGYAVRELRRAWCQEGIVTGWNGVNVGLARQLAGGERGAPCVNAVATEFRTPNLQRDLDAAQGFGCKGECHCSVSQDCRSNAWIMRRVGRDIAAARTLAILSLIRLLAEHDKPAEIRIGAHQN